jgi:hypothetical protein
MDEHTEKRGFTRGGLIKVGAAAALAVGAGGAGRALAGGSAQADLAGSGLGKPTGGAAYLQHQTFVPLVGTDFRVLRPGARALPVTLIEAKQLPSLGESFSLLFRGKKNAAVAAGTYRIEHPTLGGFDLFVGGVGRGVKGLDLEAVINRIAI